MMNSVMTLELALRQQLGIRPAEVVSFTGGGGKTTTLFAVAAEAAADGKSVLMTTTTRMNRPDLTACDFLVLSRDDRRTLRGVNRFLVPGKRLMVSEKIFYPRKLYGIPPERLDQLAALQPGADLVLVEADGSRQRPLKGHAEWEPVIPAATTLTVAVVGFRILGRPLSEEFVHRAEIAARMAGVAPGSPVTMDVLRDLLVRPDTFFKGKGRHGRRTVLLAGVPLRQRHEARGLADLLRASLPGARIVWGNLTRAGGVDDLWLESHDRDG